MASRKKIDLKKLRTYSIKDRQSKVSLKEFARPHSPSSSFKAFLDSLPDTLAAKALREIALDIINAHKGKRPVVLGMGAHPIKVGLNPVIIDLLKRGIINAMVLNGACIVHDFELAYAGKTSEDVDHSIIDGSFGMAEETGRMLNDAIKKGVKEGRGIGEAVGRMIYNSRFPNKDLSILHTCYVLKTPATVHVAIGTDIIHMHPEADGSAIGDGSLRDFRTLAGIVADLEGGVYINLGSAVLLPEVFLKALTLARNLGYKVENFTTANMDFIQHYRPRENVLRRPTIKGGRAYSLTGHHEIMFPLLAAAVIEGT